MKLITLSDHPSEQEDKARQAREAQYQDACKTRDAAIAARAQRRQTSWRELRQAILALRPWAAILGLLAWATALMQAVPRLPTLSQPSAAEAIWASGKAGEVRVRERLSKLLGDEWVAMTGYLNRSGEIDLLLVGPTAVLGVEIKSLNGLVHCNGEQWVLDRFDRHGNLVERGVPIRDQKGRPPNQQIYMAADALQSFLASRGQQVPILRAVVLAHPASRVGHLVAPGVDFVGSIIDTTFDQGILSLLGQGAAKPALDVATLVALIQRDHDFHDRRRKAVGAVESMVPVPPVPQVSSSPPPSPLPGELCRELPRVVIAPSESAGDDGQGMPALMLRHSQSLQREVRALHASRGADRAGLDRVRRTVSGHLLSGARWTVLSAASGELGQGPEGALLERLIRECGESFDLGDRTLCAVVAPLAVRLRGMRHDGQGVCAGDASQFGLPSIVLANTIGAVKVCFGAPLYDTQTLLNTDASALRDRLLEIEAGTETEPPLLKQHWVCAEPKPAWQIVYFLGVAVMPPGRVANLDGGRVQQALMSSRHLAASAFTGLPALVFNRDLFAEAVSEGFWSLHAGARQGEHLLRQHRLVQVLEGTGSGVRHGGLWYAPDQDCVRLLISGATGTREFRWELMPGESVSGFRHALDNVLASGSATLRMAAPQELDLVSYEARFRDAGLSWVGRA